MASCLIVSDDRSTTPVVMLVLRDLQWKNNELLNVKQRKNKFTVNKLNAAIVFAPFASLLVYHTASGRLHKYDRIVTHARIVLSSQQSGLESAACD